MACSQHGRPSCFRRAVLAPCPSSPSSVWSVPTALPAPPPPPQAPSPPAPLLPGLHARCRKRCWRCLPRTSCPASWAGRWTTTRPGGSGRTSWTWPCSTPRRTHQPRWDGRGGVGRSTTRAPRDALQRWSRLGSVADCGCVSLARWPNFVPARAQPLQLLDLAVCRASGCHPVLRPAGPQVTNGGSPTASAAQHSTLRVRTSLGSASSPRAALDGPYRWAAAVGGRAPPCPRFAASPSCPAACDRVLLLPCSSPAGRSLWPAQQPTRTQQTTCSTWRASPAAPHPQTPPPTAARPRARSGGRGCTAAAAPAPASMRWAPPARRQQWLMERPSMQPWYWEGSRAAGKARPTLPARRRHPRAAAAA